MTGSRAIPVRTLKRVAPAHLTAASFSLSLIILLVIFACLNPIWNATEMRQWNENIWWSYAPIPLLAGIFLAVEHKLGWASLFLESMKLTFVKFVITFLAANLLWSVFGTPGAGPSASPAFAHATGEPLFTVREAPPATPLAPETLGDVAGRVLDADGQPVAGAIVRVSAGLEGLDFAPPAEPVRLGNRGSGFHPDLAIVRTWQELVLESPEPELHTAVMSDAADQLLLNFPVVPEGERRIMFDRAFGIARVTCSVHGSAEPGTRILVVGNPFHTRTADDGSFRLEGVPAGELELAVWTTREAERVEPLRVEAGSTTSVEVRLR